MPIPTALDFARLIEARLEFDVLPSEKVAVKLREIADLLEQKDFPKLTLREAHSLQTAAGNGTISFFRCDDNAKLPLLAETSYAEHEPGGDLRDFIVLSRCR